MSVGSLRGTSELDGTTLCPFLAKNWRKFDRMSLTPLMHQNRLKTVRLTGSRTRAPKAPMHGPRQFQDGVRLIWGLSVSASGRLALWLTRRPVPLPDKTDAL